ncbi:E3 ubiquitin-protein ligase SGR9, amyloplastic-like [Neltuma alba]|uniref:E3 ubiquitin-protein ligase SGR9, amyloplastic-like n=1 Tax=Neltuma alba TaxID=207710 RepID=UPI0010A353BB|nr:E3 ubiquitin-protein ligase SGR9, amyloplastic-like [Prosopis alba]
MEERATILAAISTLPPSQLSHLSLSLLSATHLHRLRLSSVLASPSLFSATLRHLHSISLPEKYLLIARHLLFSLHRITTRFLSDLTIPSPPSPPMSTAIRQRDLNAVLLLLFFCETHQHNPTVLEENYSDWRLSLCNIFSDQLLTAAYSPVGASTWTALAPYVDMVSRSWRLVKISCGGGRRGRRRRRWRDFRA